MIRLMVLLGASALLVMLIGPRGCSAPDRNSEPREPSRSPNGCDVC